MGWRGAGADSEQAFLAKKAVSGVERPGKLAVDNVQAWQEGDRVKALFNILLEPAQLSQQAFIYASGPMAPNGLQYAFHKYGFGSAAVDLRSGNVRLGGKLSARLALVLPFPPLFWTQWTKAAEPCPSCSSGNSAVLAALLRD